MRRKSLFINTIIKYMFFVQLIIRTFCFDEKWTYSRCKNYLNDLDIICYKIIENKDGTEICKKWNYINISSSIYLPNECYNNNYNLNIIVHNTNPPMKKKLIMNLENENEENISTFEASINDYPEVKRCIKNFYIYKKNCILNKEFGKNKKCKELREYSFNSPICIKMFKHFGINIETLNDEILSYFDFTSLEFDCDSNSQIDNYIEIFEDDNYIDFEETNCEEKNDSKNGKIKNKNDDGDEEFEKYYKNSGKDCVEYGLKSLKEDIIVCTKYE